MLGSGASVRGKNQNNVIRVYGTLVGKSETPNPPDPIPIEYVHFSAPPALPENTWRGLEFHNRDLNVAMKQCTMENCKITGVLNNLEVFNASAFSNSEISLDETGLFVDQCTFSNSNILLTNYPKSIKYARIFGSSFLNSEADAVIKIDHYPAFFIDGCTITYANGTGVHLSYCGNINSEHSVKNCSIQKSGDPQDPSWGIVAWQSWLDIVNNTVTNNKYGISLTNSSCVKIAGNSAAQSFSQTQRITDNYQNQVIGFDNSFPYDFHYNIIQNSLSANPLIYYPSAVSWDPKPDPVDALGTRNVKCNCFPSNPVFYPTGGYIWQPTWCPPANCTFDEPGQEEFEMAVAAMDTGDYNAAETQFKSIIQDFPVNKYARESAKKLLPVTVLANHDLLALKNYYCTATNLHLDSVTSRLTERLMTRCDVERKDYQPAIAWYEEAILNPYSTNDSIYSIIDLEDTYMLASVDSNLKMAATGLSGQLMQYKPKSKQEYISNKDRLIRLLFKEGMDTDTSTTVLPKSIAGKCMLYQNSPNPFSAETTVSFYLPVKSDVILVVTNFLANPIKTVSMPGMESGLHSKTINFQDNPDGVYVISLNVNGNENSRIKCIKNY